MCAQDSQPLDIQRAPLKDQMELLKFLREESEANRRAQREEAESNRKLLGDAVKYASAAIAVIITVAGIFSYRDLDSFKESIRNRGEAAAKAEIKKVDEDIDRTLKAQFQKEEIQKTIQNAAEVAARKEARPLIEAGVKSQVQAAVSQQSGMIRRIAEQAVKGEVQETITPLASKMEESAAKQQIQSLIAQANADNAQAFDELFQLKDSGPVSQRKLIGDIIADRRNHALDLFQSRGQHPERCYSGTLTQGYGGNVADRIQAIADCDGYVGIEFDLKWDTSAVLRTEATITPEIVKTALEDHSLAVRAAAIFFVNQLFGGSPGFREFFDLDSGSLRDWWSKNEPNYQALELISHARMPDGRASAVLYGELIRAGATSPTALGNAIQGRLNDMKELATHNQDDPSALRQKLGRDTCNDVENDFNLRKLDDSDLYSFLEIEYLQSCPIVRDYLPRIAEYATSSRFLARRYAATMVVNKWADEKFDPFDPKGIQDWWAQHRSEYEK
jgi:hypothetical protein